MSEIFLVTCVGAFVGGFVNGLVGFGTGMAALPIWVQVLSPALAAPLTSGCSVVAQLQTLPSIWHAIDVRRLAPFVLGGIVGVPVGVALLPHVDAVQFKLTVGLLLVASCTLLLLRPPRRPMRAGGRAADAAIGFGGGILGGLAGLSGILPTLWAEVRGWEKDARRAVFQGYNLSILLLSFVSQLATGLFSAELVRLLLVALPATIVGSWLGRKMYGRLDTELFGKIVLGVLLVGGLGIVASTLR